MEGRSIGEVGDCYSLLKVVQLLHSVHKNKHYVEGQDHYQIVNNVNLIKHLHVLLWLSGRVNKFANYY